MDELRAELLPMLHGRVFQVTTAEARPKIEASGAVLANMDESFGYSFGFSEVGPRDTIQFVVGRVPFAR